MIKKISKYGYIEFEPNNDKNIWFTSDHHFFHKNIIGLCNRPFSSVEEMSEVLINNWNSVVKQNDIVFNLGDFCWSGDHKQWIKLMDKLIGKQILIIGNHDRRSCVEKVENYYKPNQHGGLDFRNVEYKLLFVRERIELRCNDRRYMLDHYPQYEWNGSFHGVHHLHGHIHEKDSSIAKVTSYNVSVERNDYRPISLKEVDILLEKQFLETKHNLTIKDLLI